MNNGTPRELKPIAEQVLVWVAGERKQWEGLLPPSYEATLRRIELCAQAVLQMSMLSDLYE